jgi:hypothetical protein
MVKFRFQDLKIWQQAINIANGLCDLADELEEKRMYRFASDKLSGFLKMKTRNVVRMNAMRYALCAMPSHRRTNE